MTSDEEAIRDAVTGIPRTPELIDRDQLKAAVTSLGIDLAHLHSITLHPRAVELSYYLLDGDGRKVELGGRGIVTATVSVPVRDADPGQPDRLEDGR